MQNSLTEMIEEKEDIMSCLMREEEKEESKWTDNERSGRNLRARRKVCMVEGTYLVYLMVPEESRKVGEVGSERRNKSVF